jgi:hypothetical protein
LPNIPGVSPLVGQASDTPNVAGSFFIAVLPTPPLNHIAIKPSDASIKWRFGLDGLAPAF